MDATALVETTVNIHNCNQCNDSQITMVAVWIPQHSWNNHGGCMDATATGIVDTTVHTTVVTNVIVAELQWEP